MFEDIIGKKSGDGVVMEEGDAKCPKCSSVTIRSIAGGFIGGGSYLQFMICDSCNFKWKIVYDSNLTIVNVEFETTWRAL